MKSFVLFAFLLSFVSASDTTTAATTGTNNTDCSCGYYDSSTKELYTDSIIVYFNESSSLSSIGLEGQEYKHHYEEGWNSLFRQGADLNHLSFVNDSAISPNISQSLALNLSKATADHLVMGASIQTLRHDIHYGTFRTYLKAPLQWTGGSALSMELYYNDTETFSLNLYSTANATESRVTMLMNRDFPDSIYGINYTTLVSDKEPNPWDFVEYRIDWSKDEMRFYIGDKAHRNVSRLSTPGLPSVPAPIHIKHWSTGNFFAMQGPPWQETTAYVGWVRFFFNTTSMSKSARTLFDSTCNVSDACSVDNMTLRGFTAYEVDATIKWKQYESPYQARIPAISLIVICSTISAFLITFSILRRKPWNRATLKKRNMYANPQENTMSSLERFVLAPTALDGVPSGTDSGTMTPSYLTGPPLMPSDFLNGRMPRPPLPTAGSSSSHWSVPRLRSAESITQENARVERLEQTNIPPTATPPAATAATAAPKAKAGLPAGKKRVDYLAGLVAVSSLLVTGIHFCLTYTNSAINPGAYEHYASETWARKTIISFTLNQNWIGPFLMTSSRFLAASYFRNGNLAALAEKTVGRTPRMIIPVFAIAMIEYFFMDAGATKWLQYLPSISWSSWPFTVGYTNFGTFISEIIELMYLIPNAAPQITFNYCTGVLWTIPVQLQGSWTVLLALVVICEIKTPWKRFGYYTFCIVNNWYGLNWGSYFWVGLLLTDLDLTYKYRSWLASHKPTYYLLCFIAFILCFGGLAIDFAPQWSTFNGATYEYGIHPDPATGRPIAQTPSAGYPQYYIPRLNGLVFSFGLQALVELSPFVQSLFSFKLFVYIFPHIFTIYLIHGFVFWSFGSALCVTLFSLGLPYWANLLILALCCYTTIFISLPLMTPLVETLGKNITADIWRFAHEKPPPKNPTLYPWGKELILHRAADSAFSVEKKTDPNVTVEAV